MMLKSLNRTTTATPRTHPIKVLQFGEGNFLRAFVDWMIDILNEKTNFNGAVQVIQPIPLGMGAALNAQEGLYHLVLNGIRHGDPVRESRLITCLAGVIDPHNDYQAFLKSAEQADLKFIVSNTTEAGISFHNSDTDPNVLPTGFPGKLTALLFHRYKFFNGDPARALTILPCELIEKNGESLRDAILQYATHWHLEDGFQQWIKQHTLFCNTLVDRIVPGFPKDTIDEIMEDIGFEDKLVVTAEPFHLWVIEPVLTPGSSIEKLKEALPLEQAGLQVKFVSDLRPYRTRKVRILNGAHTVMVPVGYLRGLRSVRDVVEDAFTGNFIRKALEDEIIPTLDLPKEELQQFSNDVLERFQNPFIRHELMSIALNSISKYQVRVLPSVLEYIRLTGKMPERLLYSLAALILFYKGEWQGADIPLNDTPSVRAIIRDAWRDGDPEIAVDRILGSQELWGTDLTQIKGFAAAVKKHLAAIYDPVKTN
jgi:tagaturonate reductase